MSCCCSSSVLTSSRGIGGRPWSLFLMFVCSIFFFFQAEDGIRDHCVTGVQTCALPISITSAWYGLRTMERARKRLTKRKRPRAPRRPTRVATPRPTPAEKRLLGLSREIARLPLAAALGKLAAAWAPGGPLLYEVATAWTESHGNKTSALALAWAREQVRLSLQEIIEATPKDKRGRIEATPETLAWVVLAGCEALAHEPPSAVADRVHALLELTGHAAPGD